MRPAATSPVSPLLVVLLVVLLALVAASATGCTATPSPPASDAAMNTPPPAIQAWMDRLTVPHTYDPETGFIVAQGVTPLPAVLTDAPRLDVAVARGAAEGRPVIAFATADRCAPCQQFKLDALQDARVIARLSTGDVLPVHIEVDREPELATEYLGGASIPMTYVLRDGVVVRTLRGQRSADELVAWLDAGA
ncbi:MAG: thioredoxin family protein [Phycisphaerales bacterium]